MSEDRTSKFFDSYAHGFNAIYGNRNTFFNNVINNFFRKSMKIRFEKTVDGCFPIEGRSVIDIGCGPGHFGITLALRGAGHVLGIDFAEGMIELARENSMAAGVEDRCEYVLGDFMKADPGAIFDYSIVMGVMDYIEEPEKFIAKVLSITRAKAFFSFPVEGGILALQRKLRYKKRCDLYMYSADDLKKIFSGLDTREVIIEKISRDFFVTVFLQ